MASELSEFDARDLSGKIQKVDERPVAQGGYSDIYQGMVHDDLQDEPILVDLFILKH